MPSPNPRYRGGVFTSLFGVVATSATDAWAVGSYQSNKGQRSLIVHWNGKAWTKLPAPTLGGSGGLLTGVAATSASDAWVVGGYTPKSSTNRAAVEHWNGKAWKFVPSPQPGGLHGIGTYLEKVVAISPTDAWAVGDYSRSATGTQLHTLIEHWDGQAWKVVPSPNPGGSYNTLYGVAAVSANDVWVVGTSSQSLHVDHGFIEHWNGQAWEIVASPNPGSTSALQGVAAISPTDAWVVGGGSHEALIEHWDGQAWKLVPSQNPGGSYRFSAVSATSVSNAWAVGSFSTNSNPSGQPLIEHWNGQAWKVAPSPSFGGCYRCSNNLDDVMATSATNAWAVGTVGPDGSCAGYQCTRNVIERWNGKT